MKSWSLIPMLTVAVVVAVLLLGHHGAAAKAGCRSPTAEDARYVVKTCSGKLAVGPIFDCCGASRSFIFSCSNCEAADQKSGVQALEAKSVVRLLDNAAKACNYNLTKFIIQELDCLGVKDWYETPLESDVRR